MSARQSNIRILQVQNGYMARVDGQLTAPEIVFACEMLKHELLANIRQSLPDTKMDLKGIPVRRADQPRNS